LKTAQAAAPLLKADLGTRMVVEMTALAGIMGREYAMREGLPPPVAVAIFEHNLPRSAGDILPTTTVGAMLAVADKLDSLVGLFAVGLAPTASADPYGLRRSALGAVMVLIDRNLSLDLREAVQIVAAVQPVPATAETQAKVIEFIAGRLRAYMLDDAGLPFDVVEAVLAAQAHNPARALSDARTLAEWTRRDDWLILLAAYARCVRITRTQPAYTINPATLSPEQSQALYDAAGRARAALKGESLAEFLTQFEQVIPAITAFFEEVLVMADDPAERENRLALLQLVASLADGYADLSKLNGF
jgi:glycyl-tRNA synthetase